MGNRANAGWAFARWVEQVPSLLLVALVYLSLKWEDLSLSSFFSAGNLLIFLTVVLLLQVLVHYLCTRSKRFVRLLGILLFLLFLVNFLGVILVDSFNRWALSMSWSNLFSGRSFSIVVFLLLSVLSLRYRRWLYVQNIFLFMLFVVVSIGQLTGRSKKHSDQEPLAMHFRHLEMDSARAGSPVMLIVLDEYESSEQLALALGDSSYFHVDSALRAKGWDTRELPTLELSTIHSLASLFNFNLSHQTSFSKRSDYKVSEDCLFTAALYDSLHNKGVKVVNRGILDLGPEQAMRRLYFYPRNFTELILRHTVVRTLQTGKPYPYNKYLLENLPRELASDPAESSFYYVHLFMPHPPFSYGEAFPERDISLTNYGAYRKFTDEKLLGLLDQLQQQRRDLRIIVTGDHGFRRGKVDKSRVFAAFYGFPEKTLQDIPTVQDLGSLVNACFPAAH